MIRMLLGRGGRLSLAQRRNACLIGLATTLLLLGIVYWSRLRSEAHHSVDPLSYLDTALTDGFMVYRNRHFEQDSPYADSADKVIVVAVDDESLRRLGSWPWPRETFVRLLERLEAGRARTIAMDILFLEPSQESEQDRELGAKVLATPNLFLGVIHFRNPKGQLCIRRPFEWLLDPSGRERLWARLGFVGVDPDKDGVLRNMPVLLDTPQGPLPSLALAAAAHYLGIPSQSVRLEDEGRTLIFRKSRLPVEQGAAPINYGAVKLDRPPEVEEQLAYADLRPYCDTIGVAELMELDDETLQAAVGNRLVLIGFTALGVYEYHDVKATPLGTIQGVYIHADLAASFLQGKFIHRLTFGQSQALVASMGLMVTLVLVLFRQTGGGLLAGILVGAHYLTALWLFDQGSLLVPVVTPWLGIILPFLTVSWYLHHVQELEEEEIRSLFGGYLSPKVVESLLALKHSGQMELEGRKLKLTVLYADIRGFTTLSEKLDAPSVVAMLNDYFRRMSRIAVRADAYIDKFIGDCMMVVFSAPIAKPDDAQRAVKVALEMQQEVSRISAERSARGEPPLMIGIGINTGVMVLGNIGGEAKRDYTVIGDQVNVAARLYQKAQSGQVLIGRATFEEVEQLVDCRPLSPLQARGRQEAVEVYEVIGLKDRPDWESTSP